MLKLQFLKSTKDFLLDIFFPSFCVSCKKEGSFLCLECKNTIIFFQNPSHFPEKSKIKKFYCMTEYRQETIKKLIHEFKYGKIKEIGKDISDMLIYYLEKNGFKKEEKQIIIAVPLHKKKLIKRGFNQSEIIAEKIQKHFKIEMENDILIRTKDTKQQTNQKSKEKRKKNIKNAFSLKNPEKIKNKNIILVDDVITTGATLKECAKTLSKAGVNKITAIVIAK